MNRRKHIKAAEYWIRQAEKWQLDNDDQVNADTCVRIAQTHLMAEETLRAEKVWGPRKVKAPKMATPAAEVEFIDAVDEPWTVAQISEWMHDRLTTCGEPHPYWNVSIYGGNLSIDAIVDSLPTVENLAKCLGAEVVEQPGATSRGGTRFSVRGELRGWKVTAFYDQPAPKQVEEPAPDTQCQWDMPDDVQPDSVRCTVQTFEGSIFCVEHADLNAEIGDRADTPAAESVPEWTREDVIGWHDQRALEAFGRSGVSVNQCQSRWNGHTCWLTEGHTGTHVEGADNSGRVIAEWSPYGVGAEDAAAVA